MVSAITVVHISSFHLVAHILWTLSQTNKPSYDGDKMAISWDSWVISIPCRHSLLSAVGSAKLAGIRCVSGGICQALSTGLKLQHAGERWEQENICLVGVGRFAVTKLCSLLGLHYWLKVKITAEIVISEKYKLEKIMLDLEISCPEQRIPWFNLVP